MPLKNDRNIIILSALAIVLLGLAAYANTFQAPFHFDDGHAIVANRTIRDASNFGAIWKYSQRRFVAYLSFALNYRYGGLDTIGYHVVNLAIHVSCAILVWWLALLTFSTPALVGKREPSDALLIAFLAGAVFVSHPIQTQAVTYIVQRATSLAAMFYLAALCLYVRGRLWLASNGRSAVGWIGIALSAASAGLAFLTKESSYTLPLAVAAYEYYFLRRPGRLKESVPAIAGIILLSATAAAVLATSGIATRETEVISRSDYLFTQLRVLVTYVRLLLVPIGQNLDYDYTVYHRFWDPHVMGGAILLASIAILIVYLWRRSRLLSFGLLWILLTLSIESSVIPIRDVIFEHRLYLPMFGFGLIMATVLTKLLAARSVVMRIAIVAALLVCYSVSTYARNEIWRDPLMLWSDTVRKSPRKARPYNNRGNIYLERGDLERALHDYTEAIACDSLYAEAFYNRGLVLGRRGQYQASIADFDRAIELSPMNPKAYNNRGRSYYNLAEYPRAVDNFRIAMFLDSLNPLIYNNMGMALARLGKPDSGLYFLDRALAIDPNYPQTKQNRHTVLELLPTTKKIKSRLWKR